MKILITGSNGYLGQSFYKKFHNEYEITCINRNIVDLVKTDEVNRFFEKSPIFDCVLHTAIKGGNRLIKDTSQILDENLQMFFNLVSHKNKIKKFINFGSGAEIFNPNSFYGLSKKVIKESIKDKNNFFNLRIFAVFDENEENRRFIKNNILNYINKRDIIIHQDKKMDFLYMQDLLKIINFYIQNNVLPKELNCCYYEKFYLSEIAEIINNLSEYKCDIKIEKEEKSENYIGETENIIELDGLFKGIKETYINLIKQ